MSRPRPWDTHDSRRQVHPTGSLHVRIEEAHLCVTDDRLHAEFPHAEEDLGMNEGVLDKLVDKRRRLWGHRAHPRCRTHALRAGHEARAERDAIPPCSLDRLVIVGAVASVLVAWIGLTDLRATKGEEHSLGPIAGAVEARSFDEVFLLSDHPEADGNTYVAWLQPRTKARITLRGVELRNPSHLEDIYLRATAVLDDILREHPDARLTFQTSAGTPAMAAVWIILAKSRYPADLLESSKHKGVRTMDAPFELSAELLSSRARAFDAGLDRIAEGIGPAHPAFRDIVHRSPAMAELLARAERVSALTAPVLLLGESGTGKELLARAIHAASGRKGKLVAINCGGIPRELVSSILFGHVKGAFTGAAEKKGAFEEAHAGTLFLDELGELTLDHQVYLLRALQEKVV
jgi:Sigma-54 interaction domain